MATQPKRKRSNRTDTEVDADDSLIIVKQEPSQGIETENAANYYFVDMTSNQIILPTNVQDVLCSASQENHDPLLSRISDEHGETQIKHKPDVSDPTSTEYLTPNEFLIVQNEPVSSGYVLSDTSDITPNINEPGTSRQKLSVETDPTCEFYVPSEDEQDSECDYGQDSDFEDSETDLQGDPKGDDASWGNDPTCMISIPFIRKEQVYISLPTDPYHIFRLIIDDDFLDLVISQTNQNGRIMSKHYWKDLTRQELLKFIGLLLHTGTFHTSELSDYWKKHYLFNLTCFSRYMSRNRFLQILKCLSFSNESSEINRLVKIQPIIDKFNKKMENIHYPGPTLIMYESKAMHKDRVLSREFMTQEQYKYLKKGYGISLHVLADPNGMVFKLNVQDGKFDIERVILDLLDEKINCGHAVYMSEQYNSIKIAETLLDKLTYVTGPLINSQVPQQLKHSKDGQKTESIFRNGVHVCKVQKSFYMSTQHANEHISHIALQTRHGIKPAAMYHNIMEKDVKEFLTVYPCLTNTLKWHKKLFIHVLHLAMVNAYHLCAKIHRERIRFYNFRLDVLEKLLPTVVQTELVSGVHTLTKIQNVRVRHRKDKGRVMLRTEVVRKACQGCKLSKKRTATMFECRLCEGSPGFCMDCFCQMHSTQPGDAS